MAKMKKKAPVAKPAAGKKGYVKPSKPGKKMS
jgi:hypothetical protein